MRPPRLTREPAPNRESYDGQSPPMPSVQPPFTSLIDAKQASLLLGVPYTWLLAQARANGIPHHRLGHYVRFNPDDLKKWLSETRIEPTTPIGRSR